MRLLSAAVIAIALSVVACAGDNNQSPSASPIESQAVDLTTDATTCEQLLDAPGNSKGRDNSIPVTWKGQLVCWRDVEGAASYRLDMTVQYYGNCDVWNERNRLALDPITEQRTVAANDTSTSLPQSPDARFTNAKDVSVVIAALDAGGNEIRTGGFGAQGEIDYLALCGAPSPTAAPTPPPSPTGQIALWRN